MNELAEQLCDGLEYMEQVTESTVTWAGAEYPCFMGAELGGKRLEQGGFRVECDLTIAVRLAVFPNGVSRPQEKQVVSYKSTPSATARKLRIKAVTTIYEAILLLGCDAEP